MASADLVLFAVNSALKLSAAAREQYIASTQSRELTFPIPDVDFTPDALSAVNWFRNEGRKYLEESVTLNGLQNRFASDDSSISIVRDLDPQKTKDLLRNYDVYFKIDLLTQGVQLGEQAGIDNAAILSLLQIRQWNQGESPHPSLLKRVAGNLIDTAVDYFVRVPNAINENSKHAKALKALVSGLDKIKFSEALGPQLGEDLPQKLLLATLETVSEHASQISSDPRFQQLISLSAQSLSQDLNKYYESVANGSGDVPIDQRSRASEIAELMFRSVLGSAAQAAVENPAFYFKQSGEADQALTSQVGGAVLKAILDSPQGELDSAFNADTLKSVMRASLRVVSQHPGLLVSQDQKALTDIVKEVSHELATYSDSLGSDLVPKVLTLILEKTAENVELFWLDEDGNPKPNALVSVAKTVISVLDTIPDEAVWRIQFTRESIEHLVSWTIQSVVDNPAWLLSKIGEENEDLALALTAIVRSIRRLDDLRLSSRNAIELIQVGLKAAMLNHEFVRQRAPEQQVFIAEVFDVILAQFFGQEVSQSQRQFIQFSLMTFITDRLLQEVAKHSAQAINLLLLAEKLKTMLNDIRNLTQPEIEQFIVQMLFDSLIEQ